jgi:hypothetical protein
MTQGCVLEPYQEPGVHTVCAPSSAFYADVVFYPQSDIVTFHDAEESPDVGAVAGNHAFSAGDATISTDIVNFFKRPVRITEFDWGSSEVAGTISESVDPWSLWANNAYVKPKLNNYAWFRGDLHVKIQVTASPFYYGLLKASYQPLPSFTPSTIVNDAGTRFLIPRSQRPHVDVVLGDADSYNMTLPFIYPANWLDIQTATKMTQLGLLDFIVYAPLQSANGVVSSSVTVTVFAWVENIELSGASVAFAMQSDEFGEGCVSKPASWVAKGASYFESIPVIGPFATATRIGASAISSIASLFGFTNVPVIADTGPMRSEVFPKLASCEIGFPVERLTLDPKNELSIDPRIVGLPSGKDEMSLSSIACRESYLTSASWSTSNLVDDTLFCSNVAPTMYDIDALTQKKLYMTPMAYVAKAFKSWRGSIIFRFHIVASKYHKGKLKISFDPSGTSGTNITGVVNTSNVVHTVIVDIGESRDVEFEVPYQQLTQFLSVRSGYTGANIGWNTNATGTFFYNGAYDNGTITVRVLNALTAPVDSSTIKILAYVRAGKDVEFANPTVIDFTSRVSMFAPQSDETSMPDEGMSTIVGPTRHNVDNQYVVHFGENVRSLRQLLRRYEVSQVEAIIPTGTAAYGTFSKSFFKFPLHPGFEANGYTAVNKIVTTPGTALYNFARLTALTWFAPSYLCYRGSLNWTFDVSAPYEVQHLRVFRDNIGGANAGLATDDTAYTTQNQLKAMVLQYPNSGGAGQALTNQRTQAGLNVQIPNCSRFKFQSTNPHYANSPPAEASTNDDGSIWDRAVLQGTFPTPVSLANGAPVVIHSYTGIGHDFGLYFFLNVPTFWVYSAQPTVV